MSTYNVHSIQVDSFLSSKIMVMKLKGIKSTSNYVDSMPHLHFICIYFLIFLLLSNKFIRSNCLDAVIYTHHPSGYILFYNFRLL